MSFYKEVPGLETTLESTLKFDTEPKAGSTNPVTSEGVKTAIDGAVGNVAENLQQQIDDISERAGSGYTPKGEATVATLNALTGQENGWLYTLTDAGTLTDGTLAVVAGDTVAWNATNEVWYKAMVYAPRQYGTNEVHNLPTTITAFRMGDVIPVDGPDGTAKISKDDLLRETSQNALLGNLAPAFDDTQAYKKYDYVVYNGKYYRFKTDRAAGAWNSSHVDAVDEDDLVLKVKAIPSTDLNDYNSTGIYEVNGTFSNYPSGETRNGSLAVFFARGSRKFQILQVGANTASSPSVLYFRVGENGTNTYGKWEQIINPDSLAEACRYTERIMVFRNLTANTDLNDCTACGYYSLSMIYTFTHTPPNWGYGFVVVYSMSGRQLQVAYDQSNNKVWQRSYASGSWGGWFNADAAPCNISKVGGSWTIAFGDYKTKLIHQVNAGIHQDTYNFPVVYKLDDTVVCPYGTDIIGPAKLATDDDFIGGVHGYCTTDPDTLKVIVDGVVYPLTNDMNISGSYITLMFTEVVMSKSTLQEVWTRDIEATFTKNEILISSKYTITSATDQVIYRLTNGGLFAVWHQDLAGAWMNTKSLCPIPSTSIADSESAKNILCEFLSPLGKIRVENIIGHELPTYKGWWQNFPNENPPRLKSYFDLIKGDTTVHPGDVFVGSARYSFTPV